MVVCEPAITEASACAGKGSLALWPASLDTYGASVNARADFDRGNVADSRFANDVVVFTLASFEATVLYEESERPFLIDACRIKGLKRLIVGLSGRRLKKLGPETGPQSYFRRSRRTRVEGIRRSGYRHPLGRFGHQWRRVR